MSLDDLVPDDAEPNLGGRPPKEEEEPREPVNEDPYTEEKDTEEYWKNLYDQTGGDIIEISSRAALLPWNVMEKLDHHGIEDFSQEDVKDDYPLRFREGRWSGGDAPAIEKAKSTENTGSGLASLINDAKGK